MTIKIRDLRTMSKEEREKKIEELKMELVKSKINASRTGGSRTREIKKLIARLITLNKVNKK